MQDLTLLLLAAGCSRSPEARKARHLERGDRYVKEEKYRDVLRGLKKRGIPDCVPEPGDHLDLGKPGIIVNLLAHELGHIPLSAPGFGCAGRHHLDWTFGR